ncbi:hypothetical protein BGW36DRAFT_355759 [Talaromyces proteolyticus]|uniref:Transcription factor domain-containing protein n=1 Tax=Talaromyces proteolyticus TaxID=1131652 RepID=A0AAD4KWH9_9EURO|nr:uncharacterized protein BGW36DRAFT_355759 [Talaromyces proteolyticus]KAH8701605.1 hypothetical protein BGW36DRAFT_355759 [Talaromyces proteolyticus]
MEQLFAIDIPSMTAEHSFLGHGVLAIASCHLSCLTSDESSKAKYTAQGAGYMNTGIPLYSQVVQKPTQHNTGALFAFACIIVLYTFFSSNQEYEEILMSYSSAEHYMSHQYPDPQLTARLTGLVVRLCDSIQGIFRVFWKCQQWVLSSPLLPAVQRHNTQRPTERQVLWARVEDQELAKLERLWTDGDDIHMVDDSDGVTGTVTPNRWQQALSGALLALRMTAMMVTQLVILDEDTQQDDPNSFSKAIPAVNPMETLHRIHRSLSDGRLEDMPSAFTWYVTLSSDFCQLLQEGDFHAMVLLAHYAIIMDRACSRKWWVGNIPSHFVATARLVLGRERESWIQWPLSVVRGVNR